MKTMLTWAAIALAKRREWMSTETTTAIVERPKPQSGALDARSDAPTETSIARTDTTEANPFVGIAAARVTQAQESVLLRPVAPDDLDILPTGEIYLSQVGYRRRLIEAFGVGGWGLVPLSKPTVSGNTLIREWALYVEGRFVSAAMGEHDYQPTNPRDSYATAAEAMKSNALMRCCKDLGIASDCWDRRFTEAFKRDHCVKVYRTKSGRDRRGEWQWRRRDAESFYDEANAPAGVDPTTGEERQPQPPRAAPSSQRRGGDEPISEGQWKRFWAIARTHEWSDDEVKSLLAANEIESSKQIPRRLYDELVKTLEAGIPDRAEPSTEDADVF